MSLAFCNADFLILPKGIRLASTLYLRIALFIDVMSICQRKMPYDVTMGLCQYLHFAS